MGPPGLRPAVQERASKACRAPIASRELQAERPLLSVGSLSRRWSWGAAWRWHAARAQCSAWLCAGWARRSSSWGMSWRRAARVPVCAASPLMARLGEALGLRVCMHAKCMPCLRCTHVIRARRWRQGRWAGPDSACRRTHGFASTATPADHIATELLLPVQGRAHGVPAQPPDRSQAL